MPNKYYYLGDCKAVMPGNGDDLLIGKSKEIYLATLPRYLVHPSLASRLKEGEEFEGMEQYEYLYCGAWQIVSADNYKSLPSEYRRIILVPPVADGKEGGVTINEVTDYIHKGIEFSKREQFKLSGEAYRMGAGFGYSCGYQDGIRDATHAAEQQNKQ